MNAMMLEAISRFGCRKFDELVAQYALYGYVYIGEDAVILAEPHGYSELINNKKSLDKCDSWYIQYAAGDVKRFFEVCPFDLEWVIFERHDQKRRRAYKFNTLKRRLINGRTKNSETKDGSCTC